MDIPKSRTILNKIHNKTLIVETIFPFVLNQPFKLYKLIVSDSSIKAKLNKLFSDIKKSNNQLDKAFIQNLKTISYIKDIINKLNKINYDLKSDDTLNYKFVKSKLNYSYINFLYNKKVNFLNNQILKNIIIEYYSTLNYIVISNVDNDFNKYIKLTRFNEKKNKQIAKLLIIFDEYCYSNSCDVIYHPNIKEIEIIFEDKYINNENLYSKLIIYLSKIKHIETIQKIIFHNVNLNNYIPYYNKIFNNNAAYQTKLCFLIDNYYKAGNKRESQFNINEVKLEDNDFLYLYEKTKIYYFINELFNKNSQIYIKDKTMIINNKNANKDFSSFNQLISSIKQSLNDNENENITTLFIINDKKILNNENISEKELEMNLNDIKEFCFISEQSENYKNLIDIILPSNTNDNNYLYEGYDKNNNLVFYRRGLENIKSFDLIDLFQYNKILTKIKLITEKIIINYNEERTKLEILNISQKKSELSIILDNRNKLSHFSPFIYNQKNLEEIKINNFDYQLKDINNSNLKIISINFEKELSTMKYKNIKGDTEFDLLKTFPMLNNLNIGGDYKWLLNLKMKDIPKNINIITKNQDKKLLKFQKKLKKSRIDINTEYLNTYEENNSEEEIEQEEEEDEDNFDFKVNNNYLGPKSKNTYKTKAKNKYVEFKKESTMNESLYTINKIIEQQRAYLVDYSSILKEYLKISKKNDFVRKFCYNSEPNSYLELRYRASDHKKLKEKIFEEIYDQIKFPSFVVKTSINVYIIFFSDFEKNHYPPTVISSKFYIFDMEGYTLYSVFKKEFLNIINFCNNFSSGELKCDIKLKDKIIPKGKTFIIEDIELFALRNTNIENILRTYIPIK